MSDPLSRIPTLQIIDGKFYWVYPNGFKISSEQEFLDTMSIAAFICIMLIIYAFYFS